MDVDTAVKLINHGICYKPGWRFVASDHTKRFEQSVHVRIEYPALNTSDEPGSEREIETYAEFAFYIGDIGEPWELYRKVIDRIIEVEIHETREFFKTNHNGAYTAPFHPHQLLGSRRWGTVEADVQFGVA